MKILKRLFGKPEWTLAQRCAFVQVMADETVFTYRSKSINSERRSISVRITDREASGDPLVQDSFKKKVLKAAETTVKERWSDVSSGLSPSEGGYVYTLVGRGSYE